MDSFKVSRYNNVIVKQNIGLISETKLAKASQALEFFPDNTTIVASRNRTLVRDITKYNYINQGYPSEEMLSRDVHGEISSMISTETLEAVQQKASIDASKIYKRCYEYGKTTYAFDSLRFKQYAKEIEANIIQNQIPWRKLREIALHLRNIVNPLECQLLIESLVILCLKMPIRQLEHIQFNFVMSIKELTKRILKFSPNKVDQLLTEGIKQNSCNSNDCIFIPGEIIQLVRSIASTHDIGFIVGDVFKQDSSDLAQVYFKAAIDYYERAKNCQGNAQLIYETYGDFCWSAIPLPLLDSLIFSPYKNSLSSKLFEFVNKLNNIINNKKEFVQHQAYRSFVCSKAALKALILVTKQIGTVLNFSNRSKLDYLPVAAANDDSSGINDLLIRIYIDAITDYSNQVLANTPLTGDKLWEIKFWIANFSKFQSCILENINCLQIISCDFIPLLDNKVEETIINLNTCMQNLIETISVTESFKVQYGYSSFELDNPLNQLLLKCRDQISFLLKVIDKLLDEVKLELKTNLIDSNKLQLAPLQLTLEEISDDEITARKVIAAAEQEDLESNFNKEIREYWDKYAIEPSLELAEGKWNDILLCFQPDRRHNNLSINYQLIAMAFNNLFRHKWRVDQARYNGLPFVGTPRRYR